jgi:serine protease AprX
VSAHLASRTVFRKLRLVGVLTAAVAVASLVVAGASWGAGYDPGSDPNSMNAMTQYTGAQAWWDAGYTGSGVDVAVIDSGVSPVPGLSSSAKVIYGPDLSLESQAANLTQLDSFGHGTFMAGLIGADQGTGTASSANSSPSIYRGMAPGARIVSIKVGTADGGTDVTQVIAAIDWVVQHAHDPGMNIRVLNLSYGTDSHQSYTVDPLAYAAEQAWKHGIVVVAAAGNSGYQRGHGAPGLADPAYDPYVIGVGGYDTNGTGAVDDDSMGGYSASGGCGKECKNPDFVAPGSHLQGLRVPGSYIDQTHPEGALGDLYVRGSGTSQATAVTSGMVALILQKYPNLTPDQVKQFITNNAQRLPGADDQAQGAGEINLNALAASNAPGYVPAPCPKVVKGQLALPCSPKLAKSDSPQKFVDSSGTGSIEQARGTDHVSQNGVALTGEQDIFGKSVDTTALATAEATASSWSGGNWNGSSWSGSSWSGSSWSGSSWSGSSWSGSSWSGSSWSGSSWSGSSWSGSSWSDAAWA